MAAQTDAELKRRATKVYTTNFLGKFIREYPPEKQAELLQGDDWLDVAAMLAMTLTNFRTEILLSRRRRAIVETNVQALVGMAFILGRQAGAKEEIEPSSG